MPYCKSQSFCVQFNKLSASKLELARYLSKERSERLYRWRLWAGFGKEWEWSKVKDLIRETLFSRVYQACKEWKGWTGRGRFFERMDLVRHLICLTLENGWIVGLGPGGLPYSETIHGFESENLQDPSIIRRIRMELNRHSDPRLTAHTYTDASMLPLSAAVGMLPMLIDEGSDSHIHSQKLVADSTKLSPTVPIEPGNVILLTAGDEVVSPAESASVPESPKPLENAPCRNRTCNPLIKSQLLCQLS